jgi:hypothetical protein
MDIIDEIALRLMPIGTKSATVMCDSSLGSVPSSACAFRHPAPKTGMPFESTFADAFAEATRLNPAVHEGAVMVGRDSASGPYIAGSSFRLFPQAEGVEGLPNRGSAFNSAQTMSCVPTVDAAYWVSGRRIYRFISGEGVELSSSRLPGRVRP